MTTNRTTITSVWACDVGSRATANYSLLTAN
jgi:hypothetical protein